MMIKDEKGKFIKGSSNPYWKGKKFSEGHKEKIRNSRKGISAYWLKGKHLSNEHKLKLIGKHNSPETEFKKDDPRLIGHKFNVGNPLSENHKKKIGLAMKNHPCYKNLERSRKISESKKDKTWEEIYGLEQAREMRIKRSQRFKGELSNTFNNWSSLEPYDKNFNIRLKKEIKERDNCCMLCNIGFEDLKLLKRQINIHHIDYNKENSLKQNLIVLCNPCHTKTNFDREIWTKHFQSLLSERYGYQYSEKGEIILKLENKNG